MDWVKIYDKHIYGWHNDQIASIVKIQLLTARLERIPTEKEMLQVVSKRSYTTLIEVLCESHTTLIEVLCKVLEDVIDIVDKRYAGRMRKQKWLSNHKNQTSEHVTGTQGNGADKIRLDNSNIIYREKPLKFVPPSLEDISKYCLEINSGVQAGRFFDYYSARGWKLKGGEKMKDWKAAIRTWERNNKEQKSEAQEPSRYEILE